MAPQTCTLYEIAKQWAKDRGTVEEHLERLALAYLNGEFDQDTEPARGDVLREFKSAIVEDESFDHVLDEFSEHSDWITASDLPDEVPLAWMGSSTRYDDLPPVLQLASKQVELTWPALRDWCARNNICPPCSMLDAVSRESTLSADLPSEWRRGRPQAHNYELIDRKLAELLQRKGFPAFSNISSVVRHLEKELGRDNLPPISTLRSHIKAWLSRQQRRLIVPESPVDEADQPR